MSRDYRKLRVFHEADALVLEIYRVTVDFPNEERSRTAVADPSRVCVMCSEHR